MKLTELNIYRYHLRLNRPLTSVGETQTHRDGLIIRVSDDAGHSGYGETAPLPGLSSESINEAAAQLQMLRKAVVMSPVPDKLWKLTDQFEEWLGHHEGRLCLFDRWLGHMNLFPSVRFGFESAILNLMANTRNTSLEKLICPQPHQVLPVNGLLAGDADEVAEAAATLTERGFRSLKLKVGRSTLEDDIALTCKVLELIPEHVSLRLDPNRAWGLTEAITFWRAVADPKIEYIEEPCKSLTLLREMLLNPAELALLVPLALDESLAEINPADLRSIGGLRAIVLKPTVLGLERAMQFARVAAEQNLLAVISSSFESRVGLTCLARMAACLNSADVAVGLGTEDWFTENLMDKQLVSTFGLIDMSNLPDVSQDINMQMLEDITND